MPDTSTNGLLGARVMSLGGQAGVTAENAYTCLKALTVDDDHARGLYPMLFQALGIQTTPAQNDDEALEYLEGVANTHGTLDVITTDLIHSPIGGVGLVKHIRNLPDEYVIAGGLRLRHLPIVVITACFSSDNVDQIHRIDPGITVIAKPADVNTFARAIDDAVSDYRASLLDELQYVGLSITWQGGRFAVQSCYAQTDESAREGKYFAGPDTELSEGYSRLVLISQRLTVAERSVAELEQLLNLSSTTERDMHNFFKRHPEFLYRRNYASHWSEPTLRSPEASVRPDFLLKPLTMPENPWEWEVLDLKRHNVELATANRRHPDLSAAVHHGCAQLRTYGRFFDDPRNHERLREQFGGIIPRPKLALVIGRLAGCDVPRIGQLRRSVPDVRILTYDEILAFRKADVERQRWLGRS